MDLVQSHISGLLNWRRAQAGNPTGTDIAYITANAASRVDAYYNPSAKHNVLMLIIGSNDIAVDLRSAAQVFADLKAYCLARKAVGWTIALATILPRLGLGDPANFNTTRGAVRASILGDASFYDALLDFGDTGTTMGADTAPNNATYYDSGKIHPTDAGYALLQLEAQLLVQGLVNQK